MTTEDVIASILEYIDQVISFHQHNRDCSAIREVKYPTVKQESAVFSWEVRQTKAPSILGAYFLRLTRNF